MFSAILKSTFSYKPTTELHIHDRFYCFMRNDFIHTTKEFSNFEHYMKKWMKLVWIFLKIYETTK